MKIYFTERNGTQVALIGKVGSTSISQAIVLADNPDYKIVSGSGADISMHYAHAGIWQASTPKVTELSNPIIPIRDPVERFLSAVAQGRITVETAIGQMELGRNYHFIPVIEWVKRAGKCRLVKFPEHINFIADSLNVPEIPKVNVGSVVNPPKPVLTSEQEEAVRVFYKEDLRLLSLTLDAGVAYEH